MTTLSIYMGVLLIVVVGAGIGMGFAWGRGAFQRHPSGFVGFAADYATNVLPLVAAIIAAELISGDAGLIVGAVLLLVIALHPSFGMARARLQRALGLK